MAPSHAPHLIDSESHGMHVFAHLPHSSAVLLDHTHHQTAAGFAVVWVVILLVQYDQKLRVGPEAVCFVSGETTELRISGGQKSMCQISHSKMLKANGG